MTELLTRAMEEASLLSPERQDEIARELLKKLLRSPRPSSLQKDVVKRPEDRLDDLLPCMKVEDRRSWMKGLLSTLAVDEDPIGAEALQKMSRRSGLEPNELSRDLIAAREE